MSPSPERALACRELVERITDHLEGARSPVERRRLEDHLARCAGCTVYVDQLRQLLRAARRLAGRRHAGALPAATRAALLAAFRHRRPRRGGAGDA